MSAPDATATKPAETSAAEAGSLDRRTWCRKRLVDLIRIARVSNPLNIYEGKLTEMLLRMLSDRLRNNRHPLKANQEPTEAIVRRKP